MEENKRNYGVNLLNINIRISGAGGHGIVFAGRVLGLAFTKKGYDVILRPSYSPAQRGGWSKVDMVVSDKEVLTPIFEEADILIVTTQDRYVEDIGIVREGRYVIYASETVNPHPLKKKVILIGVEAFRISEHVTGDRRFANSVLVGFFAGASKLIDLDTLISVYKELNVRALEENLEAVKAGFKEGSKYSITL
ncbi:MAG TPA: hypothetical protein ENF93_01760 [Ignisphaera sp.]|nr:hypothetical protein [Ignisphaera sp.]